MFTVAALIVMGACSDCPKTGAVTSATPAPPPSVTSLTPRGITEATRFNAQPDGSSALSVSGKNFDRRTLVVADGQKLATVFGNSEWVTAIMPAELYAKPGSVMVKVVRADGQESNTIEFKVDGKK